MSKKVNTSSTDESRIINITIPTLTTQGYSNKGKATQNLEKKISDAYQNYPIRKSKYSSFYSSGMKAPLRYLMYLIKTKAD